MIVKEHMRPLRAAWNATAAAIILSLLAGCGLLGKVDDDRTAKMSPAEIHTTAKEEMATGRYSEAIKLLGKLESRYPFGTWAQQAQLDTAYAYFKDGESSQALVTIERFIRLYPNHERLDYAYYLKGLVNFNEEQGVIQRLGGQDLSERDQRAAREAFEAFRLVVSRFPASPYANDAQSRLRYLLNTMAGGEVHVARYYFLRGAYLAAINRAQSAIEKYETAPALEEALFILMKSYEKLGMDTQRNDAERIMLRSFPESKLLTTGLRVDDRSWWQVWR